MNYKSVLIGWVIITVSVIYWDFQRWAEKEPVSVCHDAPIKVYHKRPMCMECKLFCEVKNND